MPNLKLAIWNFVCLSEIYQFIYGQSVQMETDHKLLIAFFEKPLDECSLRIQHMILKLQKYDLTVFYTPNIFTFIAARREELLAVGLRVAKRILSFAVLFLFLFLVGTGKYVRN